MTSFSVPFALTPQGTVQVTKNPNEIANDRVESVVGTYPGERVMQPEYGVDAPSFVFAPDLSTNQAHLATEVQQAINRWEPNIVLDSVQVLPTQSDVGIIGVDVQFTLSNDPSLTPAQIATVEIGGRVVQN
jgi:phage baseplate assembly protein W